MNKNIQSLKGIAALIVFFSHGLNMYKCEWVATLLNKPIHLLYDGQCAVILFFVISGFFYYKMEFNWRNYLNGLKKKIKRIYPSFIFIMLLSFMFFNYRLPYNKILFTDWSNSFWNTTIPVFELFKQMTLIIPSDPNLLNPPIWYMYIEVKMFILMPLVIGIYNKWSWKGIGPLMTAGIFINISTSLEVITIMSIGGIIRYFIFKKDTFLKMPLLKKYIIFISGIMLLDINNILGITPNHYTKIIQAIGGGCLIGIFYQNRIKLLEAPILLYLGRISYELYLIHFPILLYMKAFTLPSPIYILSTFLFSIILASLVHFIISYYSNCTISLKEKS